MTRKPKPPRRPRLRDIDKPLLSTYGRRYHANRDFVTARVARNRRRFRRFLMALAALLVVGAIAGWWTLRRPTSFVVTATPADARLEVTGAPRRVEAAGRAGDSTVSTGTLTVSDTPAGSYRILVTRTGFATQTVTVEARRSSTSETSVALKPLPQQLTVRATPASAKITVTDASGVVIAQGSGVASATALAGQVAVAVSAKGREPYAEEFLLDHATTLKVRLKAK